jgi:pimeloyl-ACP methyl ester carboxylesterase
LNSSSHITVDGLDTFIRTAGSDKAPPVLLVHGGGMGTSSTVWRYVLPELAKTNYVIAADSPGFGLSGIPAGEYNVPVITAHLLRMLDTLKIERVRVIGHSMGGQIAMRMAAEHPSRVDKLCLIAIGGRSLGLDYKSPGMALMEELAVDPNPEKVKQLVEMLNFRRDNIQEEIDERIETARRSGVLEAQRKLSNARGVEKAGQTERAATLIKKLKASGVPIMLIWGDEERLNPVELGDDIAKVLNWAEYHRVAGAGHNVPNDRPDKIVELLTRFLDA